MKPIHLLRKAKLDPMTMKKDHLFAETRRLYRGRADRRCGVTVSLEIGIDTWHRDEHIPELRFAEQAPDATLIDALYIHQCIHLLTWQLHRSLS